MTPGKDSFATSVNLTELLNLTNEIDVDTLASVMEEFVEVFAEQLAPFAVQLCSQLVKFYFIHT